ncbi:MAG: RecX family transcriptional regulator, partial [Oscillospiraceae bacterium]|nr:RecX family transcriptional regulator [Oscillospiraceae bacterium]
DREAVRKVSAALFRRGFSWEEIRAALRRFDSNIEEE